MSEAKIRPQIFYTVENNGREISGEYFSRSMRMFQCSTPQLRTFFLSLPYWLTFSLIEPSHIRQPAPQNVNTDMP